MSFLMSSAVFSYLIIRIRSHFMFYFSLSRAPIIPIVNALIQTILTLVFDPTFIRILPHAFAIPDFYPNSGLVGLKKNSTFSAQQAFFIAWRHQFYNLLPIEG